MGKAMETYKCGDEGYLEWLGREAVVVDRGGGIGAAAPEEEGEDGKDQQCAQDGGQDPAGAVHLRSV